MHVVAASQTHFCAGRCTARQPSRRACVPVRQRRGLGVLAFHLAEVTAIRDDDDHDWNDVYPTAALFLLGNHMLPYTIDIGAGQAVSPRGHEATNSGADPTASAGAPYRDSQCVFALVTRLVKPSALDAVPSLPWPPVLGWHHHVMWCEHIVRVDTVGLTGVTAVGAHFLHDCRHLRAVSLRGLSCAGSIGDNFLQSCLSLESIDLSPLSAVTTVGNNFLSGCLALHAIEVAPLAQVAAVGPQFLAHCGVRTVDLSPLTLLTVLPTGLLSTCLSLQSVHLRGQCAVGYIGNDVLFGCLSLRRIDLSAMVNVASIRLNFLGGCPLERAILPVSGALAKDTVGDGRGGRVHRRRRA